MHVARGGAYAGPKEVSYLFIDGGCIRGALAELSRVYANNYPLQIDFRRLGVGYSKVFYYDALPRKQDGETQDEYDQRTAEQQSLHDRLKTFDGFHVYEGEQRRSSGRRRGNEQKKIDVMITVDMLTHSFRRNMHQATLLASDLDFHPLLTALVNDGMFVTLWYPPSSTNPELPAAADRRLLFNMAYIRDMLTEDSVKQITEPATNQNPPRAYFAPVLVDWIDEEGRPCRLLQDHPNFIFERETPSANISAYAMHRDRALLEHWLRDNWGVRLPRSE